MALRNVKLTIAYDGTAYHGWQRQKDAPTVQGTIEGVLETVTGRSVTLIASGQPLNFSWNATAESYAGEIVSYRYGWDVADVTDPDDPGSLYRGLIEAREQGMAAMVLEQLEHEVAGARAVVLCDGPAPPADVMSRWLRDAEAFICTDAAGWPYTQLPRRPDLVIGDFDSLRRRGVRGIFLPFPRPSGGGPTPATPLKRRP